MTREELLRQEIEKYNKKIATYAAMVAEWEAELGIAPGISQQGRSGESVTKKAATGDDPLSMIQGMVFFRKSQPEAAKAFLDMVGYPMSTSQILAAVEKGGVTVGGKTPAAKKQNLYTSLHRSADFALAKKDNWGLVSWGLKKASDEDDDQEEDIKTSDDSKKTSAPEESKPS